MHKLNIASPPASFTEAVSKLLVAFPPASGVKTENDRWEALHCDQAYKDARDALFLNQNGLCAYCEISLSENNRQIEHFKPKSLTTKCCDLTYSFSNFFLCCKGGTNPYSSSVDEFSNIPSACANYSCGESKENIDPDGKCLNPHFLPDFPLFRERLTSDGIAFVVDSQACLKASIDPRLAESTLYFLNLNCSRLCKARKVIWDAIYDEFIYALDLPKDQQQDEFESIASTYLTPKQPFFTTALLCIVGEFPELVTL
jgi:uncharacterized protein (TIGR02646 family)